MIEPADAVTLLLAEMHASPPRAVTFWNAIQSYKLLLADALLRVPVYDVSPGEMFYDSMDGFFARPRSGFPYRTPRDYGERLAGVIVKYAAEAPLARERLGAPVHVIPNGVPLPASGPIAPLASARAGASLQRPGVSEPATDLQCPGDVPLVIGTAARLHPHKRIEDLIDAFRLARPRMPPALLRVAGGPDADCEAYAASLRQRAADLPVEWLGEVAPAEPFHQQLHVFAMISEPAGCPNASLEAMAAGLPVVATDVGGAGEQVVDGVNGRLVPPRDVAAFADALVQLAGCAACRARMGAASRRRAEERFSVERMTAAYRAVLL